MASFFIRVDVTSEAVYELVAEPIQEPQAGEQQENTVESISEELLHVIFKVLCIYVQGIDWNHRCII